MTTKYFGDIPDQSWHDWRWQLQHSTRNLVDLTVAVPDLSAEYCRAVKEYTAEFRISLTPYTMELIDHPGDTTWRQFLPLPGLSDQGRPDAYQPQGMDNWERNEEFPTPIIHHKYPNRVCLRFPGCMGACSFCLGARHNTSLDARRRLNDQIWRDTLGYIGSTSSIEEVVLSGGEPLLQSDEALDGYLGQLRRIPHLRFLRIHTRAMTFAPMRVTPELCRVLSRHRVNAVHMGVAHPRELDGVVFRQALELLKRSVPHIRAHIPLLKGVNDSYAVLKELFFGLYEVGVDPYYLIHAFPGTPLVSQHRTPVRRGIELMIRMKRHLTNPALTEYIIGHNSGKFTPPLTLESSPLCEYTNRADGWPVVRFSNWRGERVEYLDSP